MMWARVGVRRTTPETVVADSGREVRHHAHRGRSAGGISSSVAAPPRLLKRLLLHSYLFVRAPVASDIFCDLHWYPRIGKARIRAFARTGWGRLFAHR